MAKLPRLSIIERMKKEEEIVNWIQNWETVYLVYLYFLEF